MTLSAHAHDWPHIYTKIKVVDSICPSCVIVRCVRNMCSVELYSFSDDHFSQTVYVITWRALTMHALSGLVRTVGQCAQTCGHIWRGRCIQECEVLCTSHWQIRLQSLSESERHGNCSLSYLFQDLEFNTIHIRVERECCPRTYCSYFEMQRSCMQ